MKSIKFLITPHVIRLHDDIIEEFGGASGLLESAVNYPMMMSFLNKDKDLFKLSAAYFYHLIKNHPFVDGNKRTGLLSALTFLKAHDLIVEVDFESLYKLAIETAQSSVDNKEEIACFFKEYSK